MSQRPNSPSQYIRLFSFPLFSLGLGPQYLLEHSRIPPFWFPKLGLAQSCTYRPVRAIGSNRPTIVIDLHRTLKGSIIIIIISTILNRIPKWSDPRSGTVCQSCTLSTRELVVKVRSITVGVSIWGLQKVPSPGVFSSSRLFSVIHSTKSSAPVDLLCRGSHQGWWQFRSPRTIVLQDSGCGSTPLFRVLILYPLRSSSLYILIIWTLVL